MSKTYFLGGVDISELDVINLSWQTQEEKSLAGEDLARFQDLDIEVLNSPHVTWMFDPDEPTSIFYGRDIWDVSFQVKDENDETIYTGKVKTVTVNPMQGTATISIISDFNQTLDQTLEYLNDSTTPANAFYESLVLSGLTNMIGTEWKIADFLQDYNDLRARFSYTKDKNVSVFQAINEWANLCGADFFITQGKAEFSQHNTSRFVNPSIEIDIDDIFGSIQKMYDNDNILNQYSIQTQVGELSDSVIGEESRAKWGERTGLSINVDNQSPLSTTNLAGLQWGGENNILRNKDPKQYITFQLPETFQYKLSLLTTFRFNEDCEDLLGEISQYNYEIVSLTLQDNLYSVKAVRLA